MKKSILIMILLLAGIFFSAVLTTSCGSKKESSEAGEHHHETGDTASHHDMEMDSTQMAYACPMHPEVAGKEGDKCSKCGMKLEAVKSQDSTEHHDHAH